MKRLCVFCGSNPGAKPAYAEAARTVGRELARRKIGLVYGGGDIGLMGIVADAVMENGGEAIGVLPESLQAKEVGHLGLTELRIVRSMHERKAMMADLSDGFLALPGGFGTFEEFFEVVTWTQLGLHRKACGLLNVEGFYAPLLAMVAHAQNEKFIRPEHAASILCDDQPTRLLEALMHWKPPAQEKWLDRSER